ncbi:hypothetical protein EW146_g7415 [Bondarzewia mesenterica]|uniref:sphinganine-1-phosphate aldolase n=1 Tax=Bondarzewia mesenterica TaxID=1095465 RepID=A0A4V3XE91_9AGAM|nr:hypothetical protein EW146_g7415 [Bondarzewia mesenterica]
MSSMRSVADASRAFRGQLTFDNTKNLLILYLVLTRSLKAWRHVRARGLSQTTSDLYQWVAQKVVLLIMSMPEMKKKVATEMGKAKVDINNRLVPQGPGVTRHLSLSTQSRSLEWIMDEMAKMDLEGGSHTDYREGKLSGAVYHGGEDMEKVIVAAFQRYCVSNPLHPDVFPAVRKMDAEVVAMCLRMYNNPDGAGVSTSGGTESIIMSVKTHRDWACAVKGITEPEMVIPASAHAAFDKAAAYLKIKLHSIPVDRVTRQVDLKRVSRAMSVTIPVFSSIPNLSSPMQFSNVNTIMIVGSAINFPDGCQDDIVSLAKLAKKHNVGLHVDCCLGGFIMPFLEKAGFPVKPFDFRGSSVIMYRSPELRQYMYYVNPEWAGGVYASPGFSGSRPGALIAGAWAAMQYMGEEGYISSCRAIVGAAKSIERAIKSDVPELYVLGNPPASVVAFSSRRPDVNVLAVGDAMAKKGWHLNALQNPPAVHIACTRLTVPVVEAFIQDLKDSVREVKGAPMGEGTMVAIYVLRTILARSHEHPPSHACALPSRSHGMISYHRAAHGCNIRSFSSIPAERELLPFLLGGAADDPLVLPPSLS